MLLHSSLIFMMEVEVNLKIVFKYLYRHDNNKILSNTFITVYTANIENFPRSSYLKGINNLLSM